tara:strand:- start:33 stop:227 length:195 start_codon:yes stop_codon:yes gene_type:complete
MTLPEKKRLEQKLSLPPMILAIEKATALLIFKQRYKLESLRKVKELTTLPPNERHGKLEQIIGD